MTTQTLLELVTADLGPPVKTHRRESVWPCPFQDHEHDHIRPAFGVFEIDGSLGYKCHKCDAAGDDVTWLVEYRGMELAAAMQAQRGEGAPILARPTAPQSRPVAPVTPPPADWQDNATSIFIIAHDNLMSAYGDALPEDAPEKKALRWLAGRGIGRDAIRKFGLGFWHGGQGLARGVTIPGLEGKNLWYLKVHTGRKKSGRKYRQLAGGKSNALFNSSDALKPGVRHAIIVEGELDAILLSQYVPDDTAVFTQGAANQIPTVDGRSHWWAYLAALEELYIFQDGDQSGKTSLSKWRQKFPWACGLPGLGDGLDVTDYWQAGGDLREWLNEAFRRSPLPNPAEREIIDLAALSYLNTEPAAKSRLTLERMRETDRKAKFAERWGGK